MATGLEPDVFEGLPEPEDHYYAARELLREATAMTAVAAEHDNVGTFATGLLLGAQTRIQLGQLHIALGDRRTWDGKDWTRPASEIGEGGVGESLQNIAEGLTK